MKTNSTWKFLLNPFTRIAGGKALGIGLCALAAMVILMTVTALKIIPFVDADSTSKMQELADKGLMGLIYVTVPITVFFAFIAVMLFQALIMWAAGAIAGAKARFIDLWGTVGLAFAAQLAAVPLMFLLPYALSSDPGSGARIVPFVIMGLLSLISTIWSFILLYNGYKVSTGLSGNKLVISFIAAVVIFITVARIPGLIQGLNENIIT